MKIRTLWVDYSSLGEQLMPNIVLAVDEYLDDENPAYWVEQFDKEVQGAQEAGYTWRVIELEVPEGMILGAFQVQQVQADVQ